MKASLGTSTEGRSLARTWVFALASAAVLLLSGCADVYFKRGASASELGGDEKECHAKTSGKTEYEACLRDRGLHSSSFRCFFGACADPKPTRRAAATPASDQAGATREVPSRTATESDEAQVEAQNPRTSCHGGECAVVYFKRGASPGQMEADEEACHEATDSEEAYSECLRDRGWLVRDAY